MEPAAHSYLASWESFYVIVGSSGAALTGLQFVVIALVAESEQRSTSSTINAFGTPTVVHFCAALLVSAILSAPWHRLSSAGLAVGICGAAGLLYAVLVIRRARRQTGYRPVLEDWVWHAALPVLSYGALFVSALMLHQNPDRSLFLIGAAVVLLVFIGIHNAWDTVTFIAAKQPEESEKR